MRSTATIGSFKKEVSAASERPGFLPDAIWDSDVPTEAFGISVAEMVKAGAIVFAPNNGGQTEVINSPDLLFSGADDAVRKICSLFKLTLISRRLNVLCWQIIVTFLARK